MTNRPHAAVPTLIALALAAVLAVPAAAEPTVAGDDLDDLMLVLEREYRLQAIYDRAAADAGAGEPFATARREQGRRLARLIALYRAHGLTVPANPWPARLGPFAGRGAACLAGFRGELAMGGLYADLADRAGRDELSAVYRAASGAPAWIEALRDCALATDAAAAAR